MRDAAPADPRVIALRRAAGALLVVADTRLAVARALDGQGPMPSLATHASDRANAISALSEAIRAAGDGGPLVRVAYERVASSVWLGRFGEIIASSVESMQHCERAAALCDRWANVLEQAAKEASDAA